MDDLELIALAQRHAALSGRPYTKVSGFHPHQWVLDALREAYLMGQEAQEE